MTEQPQPNPQTIVSIQRREIDRLNDNRVYLMAVIEEGMQTSSAEIVRLNAVAAKLKGLLSEDVIDQAEAIIGDSHDDRD
jgi:hypothetical protein